MPQLPQFYLINNWMKVDSDMRKNSKKQLIFGIMYGLGSFGLSQRLGISRKESKEIIDNYFDKYPGIKNIYGHHYQ